MVGGEPGAHNEINGVVHGSVVQAASVGQVHIHAHARTPALPWQLPAAVPAFVGRSREISQLDKWASPPHRVVAITGTAGVGKTALAIHWATTRRERFPHGQLYLDLRGYDPRNPMTESEVLRALLEAFEVPAERVPHDLGAQAALYRSLVDGKRMVIVLDNARNADHARPALPGGSTCSVIVTSRDRLPSLVAHEQARHIVLDRLKAREARQLLVEFVGDDRVSDEAAGADALVGHCAGLPIALTIAAARAVVDPHSSLGDLAAELAALSTGDSAATDIESVFSWSYRALSADAALMFRSLGLHPGPDTDLVAAASVTGTSLTTARRAVGELLNACLLEQHQAGRYRLHDLLRLYAAKLAEAHHPEADRRSAHGRVLDHYLRSAVAASNQLNPERDPVPLPPQHPGVEVWQFADHAEALNWLKSELPVLMAAVSQAELCGFDVHAWQLPWALSDFLYRQGHWLDWGSSQRSALAAATRLGDLVAQARIHDALAGSSIGLAELDEAREHLRAGLELYRAAGDRLGEATIHHSLSLVSDRQHRYSEAAEHARAALDISRAIGNRVWEARCLNALAWACGRLGDHRHAVDLSRQALLALEAFDDDHSKASALDTLGHAQHNLGDHVGAADTYARAVVLLFALGDDFNRANTLIRLGEAQLAANDAAAARRAWREALDILDRVNHGDAEVLRGRLAELGR